MDFHIPCGLVLASDHLAIPSDSWSGFSVWCLLLVSLGCFQSPDRPVVFAIADTL